MRIAVLSLVVSLVATLAAAGAPAYVLQADHALAGLRFGSATAAEAAARFGAPATSRADSSGGCQQSWPRLGLVLLWLVTRHVCKEVGGSAYPALVARVRGGHVSALVVSPGVCE